MLGFLASVMLVGCASIGPPEPPSLELPKPPTDLRAKRKGDQVILSWTIPAKTTDRQSVRYLGRTRICRSLDAILLKCGDPVGEVGPPPNFAARKDSGDKRNASFVASLLSGLHLDAQQRGPFATVTYAVEVLNESGRGAGLSNLVHVSLAEALPPPADLAAHLTAQGVELTWTGALLPSPDFVLRSYRVFRRQEGTSQSTLVGEVAAGAAGQLSLTDQSFAWQKTYYYHADTVTEITQPGKPGVSLEGDDTAEVKVFADDVFPPAVPSGLQAVFSGPGQTAFIDLVWTPVSDADLAGYNVYRHEPGGAAVKLNAALVETPAFRDSSVGLGRNYFYAVSAVDQRGNESARSEEAEERVP